jgi:chemotaxis-related protein WspD
MEQEQQSAPLENLQGQYLNQLLSREVPQEYRSEWTRRIAEVQQEQHTGVKSVLIFRLGSEWLALPAKCIRVVAEPRAPHPLPHRRGLMQGLISVRGELLICVSLSTFLGLERAPALPVEASSAPSVTIRSAAKEQVIVAVTDRGPIAFMTDEIYGFHQYHDDELREVPSTLAQATATYTAAMLPWGNLTVGCLDDQMLFHTLNRSLT